MRNGIGGGIHLGSRTSTTRTTSLQTGDIVSFEGVYRRRTLWQWLLRRPRRLKNFIVTARTGDMVEYAEYTK